MMRTIAYDTVSLALLLGSSLFFYRAVEFLAQKDYVAGLIAVAIGVFVIRAGVEAGRLAMVARKEDK